VQIILETCCVACCNVLVSVLLYLSAVTVAGAELADTIKFLRTKPAAVEETSKSVFSTSM